MNNFSYITGTPLKPFINLSKQIALCGAIILLITLALPELGYSRLAPIDPRDAYIRKIIILKVNFQYETNSTAAEGAPVQRWSKFNQNYDFDLKGNIIDPRLIVYDAYLHYAHYSNSSNSGTKTTDDSLNMGFSSTLLRKFKYPFTIYENRSYSGTTIGDSFGVYALLRFRRLPLTTLSASYSRTHTDDLTTLDAQYAGTMIKDIGPTRNRFQFNFSKPDNNDSTYSLSFQNKTRISRYTSANMAVANHGAIGADNSSDGSGLTASISSTPSTKFTQNHSYSIFTGGSINTKSSGQSYSGGWSYKLSKKISTGFGLSISSFTQERLTSQTDNDNFFVSSGVSYNIAPNLSLSMSSSFSKHESNTFDAINDRTGDETFTLSSAVTYFRRIRGIVFHSSYSFGYLERLYLPDRGGGTGISQGLGLSIEPIVLARHLVSAGYGLSRVDNLTGDLWTNNQNFNTNLQALYWQKYLSLNGHYSYLLSSNSDSIKNTEAHNVSVSASSHILKRTSISASQSYSHSKAANTGDQVNTSLNTSLGISHSRRILGGAFSSSANLNYSKRTSRASVTSVVETATASAQINYSRTLLRRVRWISNAYYNKYTNLKTSSAGSSMLIKNRLLYRLRVWTITSEHSYSTRNGDFINTTSENRFMIKASRTFARVLR